MHSAPPAIPRPFYTQNMADLTSMTLEALKALGTPEAIDKLADSRRHHRSVLTGRCGPR